MRYTYSSSVTLTDEQIQQYGVGKLPGTVYTREITKTFKGILDRRTALRIKGSTVSYSGERFHYAPISRKRKKNQ